MDFCSAALLLTPRSLFNQLNGFDERYRPAYYDDADYCVRVWASGRSVVYEPRAAAIHYEFGSTPPEASMELQLARRPVAQRPRYRIQVAAVATPGAADDAANAAEKLGYPAVIVRERGLYKVRAGAFATREEAQAAAARVKAKLGGSPFVVAIP